MIFNYFYTNGNMSTYGFIFDLKIFKSYSEKKEFFSTLKIVIFSGDKTSKRIFFA